jgi:hypothetical protein
MEAVISPDQPTVGAPAQRPGNIILMEFNELWPALIDRWAPRITADFSGIGMFDV